MTRYKHSPSLKARLVACVLLDVQHCYRPAKMVAMQEKSFCVLEYAKVLRLRAFSVHSYANTEKLHLVTKAFCIGFASFAKLVVCVKGKAQGNHIPQRKSWST
ncbi:hypothetical protein AVEN_141674-1 [Araneus ventricosus]|uniref:Uncharacterized protein n=1 Tax=Araneus ventricosus TaxID=182803 RepID=A0A4Y2VXT0_ARAVE|nr:hypothetical protein AVEN_141674-1 [Araneus ventricosus]